MSAITAKEAMKLAFEGAKVRKTGWSKWEYVYFNNNGDLVNQNGDTFEFCVFGKWELFKDPPKEYDFVQLFDVLQDDEYAYGKNGAYVIKTPGGHLHFVDDVMEPFTGCDLISKEDISTLYMIFKKGQKPSE